MLVSSMLGALGSWGAALIEPYSDDPSTKGLLRVSPETMAKAVKMFWDDDFQVVRQIQVKPYTVSLMSPERPLHWRSCKRGCP